MDTKQEIRIRQGNGHYIFKKDWEEGHDPLKPHKEVKDDDGKITRKTPVSKSYNVCDMTDEELGDFLGEEEKKALAIARKQRKESEGRDLCKEYHEKKKKDEQENIDILTERNQVLEAHARQQEKAFTDYKKDTDKKIEKLASLIGQLMSK